MLYEPLLRNVQQAYIVCIMISLRTTSHFSQLMLNFLEKKSRHIAIFFRSKVKRFPK